MPRRRAQGAAVGLAAALLLLLGGCASSDAPSTTRHRLPAGLQGVGHLPAPASVWPAAGFDARRSSGTTAVGPDRGVVRWSRDLGAAVTPGPVLGVDGSVLVATNGGVLHALDPSSGADRWTFTADGTFGGDLSTSPAVLSDGTVLWPGPDDTLYAVDRDGRPLWRERLPGMPLSPAVAGRHRVYVADLDGHLTALVVDGASHRAVWTLNLGGTDYASPSVGLDGTVYTAADSDVVAVRDLGDRGAVSWRFHARRTVEVSTAVSPGGLIMVGTNHDRQWALRPDGSVAWGIDLGDYTYSSPTVRPDGSLSFGDNMGRVRVVDAATGVVRRLIAPLGAGREKVWTNVVADARSDIYWATTAGNVYGYTRSGRRLFSVQVPSAVWSYPALADGTLYVADTGGTVSAIG